MSIGNVQGSVDTRPTESILGIGYSLLVGGAQTDGAYDLMLFEAPPGIGPPPHVHTQEDELFYVVDGAIEVLRGDETLQLEAGDYVCLPRNVVHAFQNNGQATARFLCWVTPGRLEAFFDAFKREWPADEDAPPPPNEEDISKMLAAAEKYGIEIRM